MACPSVHVGIVNWNTAESALECVAAFQRSRGVETRITLVDNDSDPGQQAVLRAGLAVLAVEVEVRWEAQNIGFGRAANLALRMADADLICVANADVEPEPEMLHRLAVRVLADPRIGLAAPVLKGARHGYHSELPTPLLLPARAFAGSLGHRRVADPSPGTTREVGQPAGACLVARLGVWRELGGFDPRFFLWFEDVDLARRARQAGYANVVVGSAFAQHAGAQAFAQLDPGARQEIRLESLGLYTAKHHPRIGRITRAAIALARPLRVRAGRRRRPVSAHQPADFEQLQEVGDQEAGRGSGGDAGHTVRRLENQRDDD